MLRSLVYTVVCALLDLLLARSSAGRAQFVELLALRHEVRVLRRQVKRTRWSRDCGGPSCVPRRRIRAWT